MLIYCQLQRIRYVDGKKTFQLEGVFDCSDKINDILINKHVLEEKINISDYTKGMDNLLCKSS